MLFLYLTFSFEGFSRQFTLRILHARTVYYVIFGAIVLQRKTIHLVKKVLCQLYLCSYARDFTDTPQLPPCGNGLQSMQVFIRWIRIKGNLALEEIDFMLHLRLLTWDFHEASHFTPYTSGCHPPIINGNSFQERRILSLVCHFPLEGFSLKLTPCISLAPAVNI